MSPAILSAAITLVFFVAALAGAAVVFRFLRSTAQITRKDVQLGGAIAGFVVMFYLLQNSYSAGFPLSREDFQMARAVAQPVRVVSETGAAEINPVGPSASNQRSTLHDIQALDRNRFEIDGDLRLAIARPAGDKWEVGRLAGYECIGTYDVPIYKIIFSMSDGDDTPPVTFGIRSKKRHTVELDGQSLIASIPMAFNPYSNERFIDRVIARMYPGQLTPEMASAVKKDMTANFASLIKRELPIDKTIANGIYVTLVSKSDMKSSEILKMNPRENMLEAAQIYFAADGFIPQGTSQNEILDNDKGIMSFNASVGLSGAIVDGRRGDILINNVGFIIDLGEKVAAVSIVFLGADSVEEFKSLEASFTSLQLGTW